ncbi:hypothetical protein MPER_03503 [Moniliophthora perniciosa FA553]|nr:hypothetical protein MPER_03503 [Moniliophthora perniciosa FA553]
MQSVAFMIAGVEAWFAAHISRHPAIQKKAHEELDKIVGRDRLPTHHDQAQLHFCRAIIKESYEDFTFRGYSIPKDTVVICNTYSLHFNEQRYPDPYAFNRAATFSDPHKKDTLTASPPGGCLLRLFL